MAQHFENFALTSLNAFRDITATVSSIYLKLGNPLQREISSENREGKNALTYVVNYNVTRPYDTNIDRWPVVSTPGRTLIRTVLYSNCSALYLLSIALRLCSFNTGC